MKDIDIVGKADDLTATWLNSAKIATGSKDVDKYEKLIERLAVLSIKSNKRIKTSYKEKKFITTDKELTPLQVEACSYILNNKSYISKRTRAVLKYNTKNDSNLNLKLFKGYR